MGLATLTAATVGSVLAGELIRRFRRRLARAETGRRRRADDADRGTAAGRRRRGGTRSASPARATTRRVATRRCCSTCSPGSPASFALARLSTQGIRAGWWPFGNVSIGGRHIHHFVPGILLAFGSATAALLVEDPDREAMLAVPFGVGVGLTFDESALLLDLRDVYWTREGLLSVQVSLGGLVLLGGTILALRMLRRGELAEEDAGEIPDAAGAMSPIPPWGSPAPSIA